MASRPGASLTIDEKVQIARQLARLRVDVIEAGFPAASPGEAEAVRRIASEVGAGAKAPAIAALARCVEGDVSAAAAALAPATHQHLHVFIATSEIHLVHKLRATRDEVLERIRARVAQARQAVGPDGTVEFSAEDASRTELDYLLTAYERRSRRAPASSTCRTRSATRSPTSSRRWCAASCARSAAERP